MYKLFLSVFLLLFLLDGCSTQKELPPVKKPNWIDYPSSDQLIGAVGSAMPHFKGKTAQRRLAISRAIDELAQQSGVQVQSTILRKESREGSQIQASAEVYTIQNSENKTIHAHIEAVWTHPRTEEIYVWLLEN
jgi:uncharacterized protein YcfL